MGEPIRVLLVDDEPDVLDLSRTYLERVDDDLRVQTAVGGPAGLDVLESAARRVDCVVSDYDMPELDGLSFLRRVRETHPNLPFILFTGKGSEEIASEAIAAGVTDYLQKDSGPECYEILANRVENAVERCRAERRASDLHRINRVIRRIQRGLVAADARDDIEALVCDEFATADPYEFATICVLGDDDALDVRAMAGDATDYVLEVAGELSAEERRDTPGAVAARTNELITIENLHTDPAFEPWRKYLGPVDLQSLAAIPLTYGDADYGVLVVFAGRPHSFDAEERAVLNELGDTVARAIDAAETSRALDFVHEVVEGVDVGVGAYDEDGTIVYANRAFTERLGYDDVVGIPVWEVTESFDREGFPPYWEKFEPGTTETKETEHVQADGTPFPVEATTTRVTIGGDDYHVGTISDISERVANRQELETLARRFQAVFDDPAAFIGLLEPDGTVMQVNETARSFADVEASDVVGEPFWDTPWWDFSEAVQADLRDRIAAAADGEFVRFEVENRGSGGVSVTLDTIIRPVHDDAGEVVALIAEGRNITDRKHLERELRRSRDALQELYEASSSPGTTFEERLQHVLETGSDHLDLPMAILTSNLEGTRVGILGAHGVPDLERGDELDVGDEYVRLVEARDGKLEIPEALELERGRDLTEYWGVRAALGRAVYVEGERAGMLWFLAREPRPGGFSDFECTFVELLARWASDELEQRRANEQLERQNERLERFAAIVTHDLRNPLTSAVGWLDLVRSETGDERLDRVADALDRMDELIEDIRTMTWSGSEISDPVPVPLDRVARAAWTTCKRNGAVLDLDDDLGTVRGDESRIQQLLENLFRNAIDHAGDGVTVSVHATPGGFAVTDDGPGIPAADRETIFDHGFSTTTGGTGFGLSIVSEIAAAHGWTISVRESDSGGAHFEFGGVEVVDAGD